MENWEIKCWKFKILLLLLKDYHSNKFTLYFYLIIKSILLYSLNVNKVSCGSYHTACIIGLIIHLIINKAFLLN